MQITAFRPGETENITLSDSYQKLTSLFDISGADGVIIQTKTNGLEVAFSKNQPTVYGLALSTDGDTLNWSNRKAVEDMWLRNNIAGYNAVLIMTPLYAN